jgi:peptidoglycan-N-acetylglucosamine deacetylase
MSTLQMCWLAVTATTVVFLVVAAISALPKMKAAYTASIAAIFLTASGITAFGSLAPLLSVAGLAPPGHAAVVPFRLPPPPVPGAPLANDASAGKVVFTFDDGPDVHTPAVIAELNALHVRSVFFLIGKKVASRQQIVAAEVASGEVIGNHTWDHPSLTGKATGTRPLSQAQVREELTRANAAIVTAGAPEPSLWRPPYGGVDAADAATARVLGLRVVLDSGDNIIDSNDWAGLSAEQIARRVDPRLRDGTIIAFHDGLRTATPATIRALPLIVTYMNAHHLGATTAVRPDATGGVVPYPGARPAGGTTLPPRRPPLPVAPQPATSSPAPATVTEPDTPTAPASAPGTTAPAPAPSTRTPGPPPSTTTPAPAPATTSPAPVPSTTRPAPPPSTTAPAPHLTASTPAPATTSPAPAPTRGR